MKTSPNYNRIPVPRPEHGSCGSQFALAPARSVKRRSAKIMVVFALLLPAMLGMIGVVIDGTLLTAEQRQLQSTADAAVTAAAMHVLQGRPQRMTNTVQEYVRQQTGLADTRIELRYPPLTGPHAADDNYVELLLSRDVETYLVHVLGGASLRSISARAVAGSETSTSPAAIMLLAKTPRRTAGLSIDTNRAVRVEGAILVNNEHGAQDENGQPAGRTAGSTYAVRSRGQLAADQLRVAGGVDDPEHYADAHLRANQLTVENPLRRLAPPSGNLDDRRGIDDDFGGVQIPAWGQGRGHRQRGITLDPGTYDWIRVTSGPVTFRPGIYRLRSVHPSTRVALELQGDDIVAAGVLFYIENDGSGWSSGGPGDQDGRRWFGGFWNPTSERSVVIDVGSQSQFSPLRDESSPYHGLFLFQDPQDDRTLQLDCTSGSASALQGIIYAQRGHVSLTVEGTCRAAFVAGTMEIESPRGCRIDPTDVLPPARDIYLVE